ncbi:MAG: asparagine synthase (glutamine-hydrolyzing) [Alphaproteobacteria bacterium]|nr:asparagine synthase (glutamine-hydrolyzing) [Alphaproteobacteria bacterium]MBU1516017.1 asparagine synthase (glutamine-hydrolyzing) [Alphaproteobacteria bacterium]MBU2092768.1 asparagine synthase (glutamine-hydrolyzing) [Alphaproteobacteria bacterium]MBU2153707.1 asparagine synthase (glutamine-hydrolyzing) [Alphaproteobacteria bacterium]MBU2308335.1 asparagine synthase (glutamine-hydrolyzing) [Alphaproteobacteria bacterium]
MCGIAGQLGGAGQAAVEPMIRALQHRGPDGVRLESLAEAALAHARLSIIDLEGGWQPLHAAGGTVIGNGEIYNYVELAKDFGLSTATGSDFEPLLHLYAREGEAAFARLRGMYAFCLIGPDGRAWLARDPFGIKPLYIMEHAGGLAFASEPRAFFAAGLMTKVLDEGAARELVDLNYVLGERTPFQGLRRLAPGEVVEVRDGRIVSGKRKSPLLPRPNEDGEDQELLTRLDAVLEDSVRVHQRSDVPYGLFLSGGIDSTAIATLMSRLNERPVTAFTCGFDAPGAKDERRQAETVARALNLDWRETTFGEADFWRILPQVAWALDDPTADYAALPTYKLAEAAKGTLTVVLTGEGGDELFGGYGRYRRALRPKLLGGRPAEPRGARPEVLAAWREQARAPRGLTALQGAQWADVVTWLPNDLLLKLDRCLMAHGLEGRTPFLDREVAAFAWSLPDRFKVRGGYGKWLLRKWLEHACPAAAPWAKKQGFTVPVETWIAPRAADIRRGLAKIDAVRRLGGPPAEGSLWPWLFFGVWALIHLEDASPAEALRAVVGEI